MRNLKKYSNHSGYSVNESLGKIVSICKTENHVHYEGRPYTHKIEYLQSSGTQWIDTEIIPDVNTHFKIDCTITNTNNVDYGCLQSNKRFHIGKYTNCFYFGVGSDWKTTIAQDNARHILELDSNGTATVDGTDYTVGSGYSGTGITCSLFLFARNNGTTGKYPTSGNLYAAQISQGGVLVRDMYPVRVGQVGYMYDRISKRLFGNSGTGTFTLGPDV